VKVRVRLLYPAAVCFLGLLFVAAEQTPAIVVSDDPDLHVVVPPSDYDLVGYLDAAGGTTASLVDPWFVLTAGHAAAWIEGRTFTLHLADGPHVFALAEAFAHPSADLAVVRLGASTGLPGYELYDLPDEAGQIGLLVGYGMSGTGDTVGEGGDPSYPRGTKRLGYNKIDSIYTDLDGVKHLRTDFDAPGTPGPSGSLGDDREAMFAAGDSGGPTFIEGTLLIAGVHVSIVYNDPDHWPSYGDRGHDVRVSTYADWIRGVIPDVPATQTGDFNMDEGVDALDINALFAELREGGADLWYDLTGDGFVNGGDTDKLIRQILATEYGDANLDGAVDGLDYGEWSAHYQMAGAGWREGDFNGDGIADGLDYNIWSLYYQGGAGAQAPEPAAVSLLAIGALALLLRRRK
jgi:hypothetical protein